MTSVEIEDEDVLGTPDPNEAIQIDPKQMNDEFIQLPGQLGYWGEQYARAQIACMRADLGFKRLKRQVYLNLRAGKEKGDTEEALKAKTDVHPDVVSAEDLTIDREAERLRLHVVVEAIRTKREMLVSLGAHVRAELGGDPMVRRANQQDLERAAARTVARSYEVDGDVED